MEPIIKLFEEKKIRTHWNIEERKWYFSGMNVDGEFQPTIPLKKLVVQPQACIRKVLITF